ncbi:disease resistance protein RPV1-like isoform X3 [Quercus robur]|uniref:disease resistance protein RPV1-like isoform X3 n=1 Tax=Quercus robur TaxID=38942 RepID=UPI002162924F|nr:disease resistance protein RPV1-like isoform X3 [Quercus robur]
MAFLATENASSSSSSPIPPSSTPGCKYEYDVFLSFRGTDTRNNFTDHLYDRLKQEGIFTFRDDEGLEQGTEMNSGLLRAIDESKIAVVVLSKQYASSSWCLIELAKIVECMNKKKLTVLSVFHYVDPSDVRYQNGSFAEAFAKHENRFNDDDVKTWRAALTEVANLSGWHLKDNSESEVIKKIIQRISSELDHEVPFVSEHLVGMDSRVKEMLDLCFGERLNCVRLVGICGMGGIGKTALAREIYNRIFRNFEASSFIANVREESESQRLVSLQNNLLSKILMGTEKKISDVEEGKKILRNRLCNKKVLIVLDDVNDDKQLKALVGKDWFGLGSIIIVTSRDSHLLKTYWDGVIDIYIAKELNHDEAMELFSLKAFKKPHLEENYVDLSIYFVNYANGLPLALRVLGSSLFGKTLDVWRSARDKLEAKPNRDIMDVLELSVVGLDDTQRDLFLDIAFLFKDMANYRIRDTLESLGHYTYDIDVLQDKSLITITSNGALWMHDLLKEMGQDIVRRESLEEPGKRSRLWSYKDVLHVLTSNVGTKVVKGIMLNMPIEAVERLSAEAFTKMKNLRFLKIGYVHPSQDLIGGPIQLPQGLSYLSNELRIIDWCGYPLKSMPTSFQPNKLVELRMHNSEIKQLWKGIMILNELKLINLSDSQNLIEIPDLSGVPKLKQLIIQRCTRLYKIHASLGDLKRLIQLDLNGCKCLESLPHKINLEALETLILSGCSRLKKFPEVVGNMSCLSKLSLNGTAITGLPLSIEHLIGLTKLDIRDCKNLSSLPNGCYSSMSLKSLNLFGCSKLVKLPENLGNIETLVELDVSGTAITGLPLSIEHLIGLTILDIRDCKNLSSLPNGCYSSMSLKSLNLSGCSKLVKLPENLGNIKTLKELDVSGTAITGLPLSIEHLIGLTKLDIRDCKNLSSLPNGCYSLMSLKSLNLSGCSTLVKLSENLGNIKTLKELDVSGIAITGLPLSIGHLIGLTKLDLRDCKNLSSLPNSCYSLMSLKSLNLSGCSKLVKLPENLGNIKTLKELDVSGTAITGLPLSIENLIGLTKLDLRDCKNLSSLPNSCYSSMSLRTLNLSGCSKLDELPENLGKIESLEELDLGGTAITGLPSSVVHLKNLKVVSLCGCVGLSSNKLTRFSLMQPRRSPDPMSTLERSLIGLCSLTKLDLSYCNVQTIPKVLGCLSSLESLNLRGNNFVCLPESIVQLSNLRWLYMGGCTHLRMLPKLPLNIEYIDVTKCTSLETLSLRPENDFRGGLRLLNCDKLIKNQGYGDLVSTMLRPYIINTQGYCEKDMEDSYVMIPGSEIPKWFSHQNVGALVSLQVPSDLLCNKFIGIAVCAVFVFRQHHPLHQLHIDDFGHMIGTHYLKVFVGGIEQMSLILSEEFGKIESYQLCLVYFPSTYFEPDWEEILNEVDANGFSQIEVKFEPKGPGLEVTKCGAHLYLGETLKT